jgi:hypothetical protein
MNELAHALLAQPRAQDLWGYQAGPVAGKRQSADWQLTAEGSKGK